jgi:hypothetical protein
MKPYAMSERSEPVDKIYPLFPALPQILLEDTELN